MFSRYAIWLQHHNVATPTALIDGLSSAYHYLGKESQFHRVDCVANFSAYCKQFGSGLKGQSIPRAFLLEHREDRPRAELWHKLEPLDPVWLGADDGGGSWPWKADAAPTFGDLSKAVGEAVRHHVTGAGGKKAELKAAKDNNAVEGRRPWEALREAVRGYALMVNDPVAMAELEEAVTELDESNWKALPFHWKPFAAESSDRVGQGEGKEEKPPPAAVLYAIGKKPRKFDDLKDHPPASGWRFAVSYRLTPDLVVCCPGDFVAVPSRSSVDRKMPIYDANLTLTGWRTVSVVPEVGDPDCPPLPKHTNMEQWRQRFWLAEIISVDSIAHVKPRDTSISTSVPIAGAWALGDVGGVWLRRQRCVGPKRRTSMANTRC
jgi:hypothetical protein